MKITAHTDGASRGNPGESGIGVIMRSAEGIVLYAGGGYIGTTTNNVAEYSALIFCLRKAVEMGCSDLVVLSDSELMVRQINGAYRVKDAHLKELFEEVKQLVGRAKFPFTIRHIDRGQNREADLLANGGIDSKSPPR
ncbi:MAG TPA: ribonuclease HI family protein [Bacteroidota bacterium]|nr:ribonuclease HI family protein [Bacteroidota bacterium]